LHDRRGNARSREGESTSRANAALVFVEVRMRSGSAYGAATSIDDKQRRSRAAQHWLLQVRRALASHARFDIITVDRDGTIDWIRDAFAA
jgi:Holliday junction resolvase-like predicted endonuclease